MTNPSFTGSVAELDSEFVTHVRLFLITVVIWSWRRVFQGFPWFLQHLNKIIFRLCFGQRPIFGISTFPFKVRELVKTLLEGLVPKQEAGKTLRCRDLVHYFKAYVNILNR